MHTHMGWIRSAGVAAVCLSWALGCGSSEPAGVRVSMDLEAANGAGHFFDHPFPSDLRIDGAGRPRVERYPNPTGSPLLGDLIAESGDRTGFSTQSTVYFRFDGPVAARRIDEPIAAAVGAPVLLVDVDPNSPARGSLHPVVAQTLAVESEWAPLQVLAIAPLPGVILRAKTTYAVLIARAFGDADGKPLAASPELRALAAGKASARTGGAGALGVYAPLWETLDELGIDPDDMAAATVFTTGDVVAELAALSDAVIAAHPVTLEGLELAPGGADNERFCELRATARMPQFQAGTPPFNSGGLFVMGSDGRPELQRMETTPVVITMPKAPMPAGGYPLMLYFHGSGGEAAQVVDRGRFNGVSQTKGEGPAFVVAEHGIGAVAASLPLSPDRLPGAGAIEYLNFQNLAAFRDTFRQGVLESRLLLSAVLELEVEPAIVEACGLSLPDGASRYAFDPEKVVVSGQSMGGMYTNLVAPIDDRVRAAVPTGAGGHWNRMILSTSVVPGAIDLISLLVRTDAATVSFVHPGLNLLSMAWESAEPFVFMPRLGRRPLPGHDPIPVYEPVGLDDEYFAPEIYDAAAIAYGNQMAGDEVWPSMRRALALLGLDELVSYPVAGNRTSESGQPYTGVVVQYPSDGILNGHYIFAQLDEVKFQYGCFLATALAKGNAVVPQPSPLGSKCPL